MLALPRASRQSGLDPACCNLPWQGGGKPAGTHHPGVGMQHRAAIEMIEAETAAGRWRHLRAAPSARLRYFTRRIKGYEEAGGPGVARTETPTLATARRRGTTNPACGMHALQ